MGDGEGGDDGTTREERKVQTLFKLFSLDFSERERKRAANEKKKLEQKTRKKYSKIFQGFNAVRLPFRFRDVAPGRVPYNYTRLCGVPSQDDAKSSSVVPPPDLRPTLLPAATRTISTKNGGNAGAPASSSAVKVPLRLPSRDFPDIPPFPNSSKGVCNALMPQLDSRERFLWNVKLLIEQVSFF